MWRRTTPSTSADPPLRPSSRSVRAARAVVLASTALFLLVACRWRPWDLFDRAGFSNDFYDEQARAFLHGHLAVDPAVAGMEGFVIDGKTYLYYGPFLALVRMPFALLGDVFTGRLVRISMVIGFAALLTATFHLGELARAWFHRSFPERAQGDGGDVWWRTPLLVAAVACSPVLFLGGWVSVYHETELWACTFAVWAAVGTLRCWDSGQRRDALLAAGAAAAATLVRAPVGLGATVGLGVVALLLWRRGRPRPALTMAAVAGLGALAHFAVNVAKFGSVFGLPGDRQVLTLQNAVRAEWFEGNGGSFFGARFLPTTVAHYLRPDTVRFERLVPFVRFGPPAEEYGSYPLESNTPAASLTTSATLLFLAGIVGVVVLARRRGWPWLAIVAGGCIAAVPSFLIGFVGNRYLVDMLPALIVPAAVACWALPMPARVRVRRAAQGALLALVLWGTWCNVALATWVQNLKEPGFTAWRYEIDDALFGDPAPGLISFDPDAPVPRDGVVAIDLDETGACRAVYIAEQGGWVPLERAEGTRVLTARVTADALTAGRLSLLAGGERWSVTMWMSADGAPTATFAYEIDGAEVTSGEHAITQQSTFRIVADPVTPELSLTVDGDQVLFSFAVAPDPMVPGAAAVRAGAGGETLCRQLQARR